MSLPWNSRGMLAITNAIPDGWKVRLARAYSIAHDDMLWTVWVDEPVMGWSEWHSDVDPWALIDWVRQYVDECMASCVPDQGKPIPKPSKCDVTQGGDTGYTPKRLGSACPACRGDEGAVMHVNCIMRRAAAPTSR